MHQPSRRPGHPTSCTVLSSSALAERPLAASTDHVHRIPPPRIITTAGNCFPSRTARSLWRLIHRVQRASVRTACMSPRHVCTSTVVCGSPNVVHVVAAEGCVQSVKAVVRELAVLRVAGWHAQREHRHTARSQGSVRAPPAPHRAFSLAHVASAGVPLVLLPLFVRLDTLHE